MRSAVRSTLLVVAVLGAGCSTAPPELERQLARLEAEIEEGRRAEKRLTELERDLRTVDAQLQQLQSVLATGEEDALARLRLALLDSGFGRPEIEPGGRGRLGDAPVLRFDVRASVAAGTAGEALAALEAQPLLVVVEGLSWSRGAEQGPERLAFVAAVGLVEPEP